MPSDTAGNSPKQIGSNRRAKALIFCVGLPLVLALVSATQPGYTNIFGLGGALLYLGLISLIPWWIAEATTWAVWWAGRTVRPPLWALCGLGFLLGFVIAYTFVLLVTDIFIQFWPEAASSDVLVSSSTGLVGTLIHSFHGMAYWILANYLFDRLLGFPRFRYEQPLCERGEPLAVTTGDLKGPTSKLLERSERFHYLSDILLMKAEEHYVRLYGEDAEELVPHRFGQAILDLAGEDGFRVHRSFWVRRAAVEKMCERSGRVELCLHSGKEVPVSRQYHGLVRQVFAECTVDGNARTPVS
ncbi:MAG: LytTR family DNA-binding domain-containing protein [Pseudomonadota bacterium]